MVEIDGTNGVDYITGTDSDEQIFGYDGDDTLRGGWGNDILYGDAGNDALYGDEGDDQLHGGAGNDVLFGGAGNNLLDGGSGYNVARFDDLATGVIASLQTGVATSGGYSNSLIAINELHGSSFADTLIGASSTANRLYGEDGPDTIIGGNLADYLLSGGAGDDVITGGAGGDYLLGGDGNDLFRDTAANFKSDTIADFTKGDRIQVTDATFENFSYTTHRDYGSNMLVGLPGGVIFSINTGGAYSAAPHLIVSAASDGGTLLAAGHHLSYLNDFNADGHSDLLWRNDSGAFSTWGIAGNTAANQMQVNATYNPGVDTAWQIKETGDFNGDGNTDLLWQNVTTGNISVWRYDGSSAGFQQNSLNASPGVDWKVAAVGDFNGDGLEDIVFRNEKLGAFSVWQTQNFGANATYVSGITADWKIVGAADFDGDGKSDILWRNAGSGAFSIWSAAGGGDFDSNTLFNTDVTTDWHITGIGDFNGDGKDDLLWRNNDGTLTEWQSNGHNFTPNVYVDKSVGTDWQVAQIGDFNDDGKADLLWRNQVTGDFSTWQSTGNGFTPNTAYVTGVDTSWHVQGHQFLATN